MAKAVWEVIRMTKMTKEAERVKNSERAPYTESELRELSKEELQGLYLGFYEKDSGRLREPGLIKAILEFESKITEKETVTMVKTNEVTTVKTKTLSELQDRVEVLKGIYELYCLQVKTSKYHLQDVMSKENRTCYEVMQARDEYKSARYERFRTYVEYRKMLSELRAATEIRKETITMTEKAKLTVKELDEAIKSASNRDEAETLLKEATVKTLRGLMRCLNGFDGEWYRARKAELIEALLDYYGSVWEKETETTEQIIAEIESAETLSEIRAVLNECTKGELHEVYESITGNSGESNSWKKDDLVSWYSKKILAHKESEKQNEAIEELTEEYVSDEEKKLSEICQKANKIEEEVEKKEKTANVFEFKAAFDELERGRVFVNISELRKKLNWPYDVFDEMLRKLRDEETIRLVKTEVGNFDVKDFFYDEDNQRRGMVTWNKSLSA